MNPRVITTAYTRPAEARLSSTSGVRAGDAWRYALNNMPTPAFISQNSRFFENLLEYRFLFDLRRHLVLAEVPQILNVLKSEVDAFGFDLVLAVADHSIHVQMKTRSGVPSNSPYELSEALWNLSSACAIWMLYDPVALEPSSYYVLGFPMPAIEGFVAAERHGYRKVWMRQANHRRLTLPELANLLFPVVRRA